MGKILRIDLSNQFAKEEVVSEELAKNYLGGVGFAFKHLYDEVRPGTAALDKENKLWPVNALCSLLDALTLTSDFS